MNTVKGEVTNQIEITKSVFITHIKHVTSVSAAKAYIATIKAKYADATHNITLYIVGPGGEYGHYSDDGEPSGTAGMPAFDVFRKNNLTNLVCVITRYFGGVKLGAGGLVRAYSKSASEALKQMELVPIIDYVNLTLSFDYSYYAQIELILRKYEIITKTFTHDVNLLVRLPETLKAATINALIELTNNQIKITTIMPSPDDELEIAD